MPLAFAFDGATVLMLPLLLRPAVPDDRLASAVGLVSFAALLGAVVLQPLAGALSDRLQPAWGRRGFLLAATVPLMLALVLLRVSVALAGIVAAYAGLQLAASAVQAAQQGFIPDLVPPAWRGRAAGLKGLFDVGGGFLAFAILADLLGRGEMDIAVALIAGLFAAALILLLALVREPRRVRQPRGGTGHQAAPASGRMGGPFVRLVVSRFAFLFGIYVVGRFFVLLLADRLGVDVQEAVGDAGPLLAALTLITAVAAVPAGWIADHAGRPPVMAAGAIVATLGIVGLTVANGEPALLLFGGLMATGSGAFAAANWAMTADVVPGAEAARFMGLANIGTGGAAAAAGLLGPVLDVVGPANGFTLLLLVAAVSTAVSILPLRGMGGLPALPAGAAA